MNTQKSGTRVLPRLCLWVGLGLFLNTIGCTAEARPWMPGEVAITSRVKLVAQSEGNLVHFLADGGALLVDSGTRSGRAGTTELPESQAAGIRFVVKCHRHGVLRTMAPEWVLVCHSNTELLEGGDTNSTGLSFQTNLDLSLGDQKVFCYHKGQAYSDGDCIVYFPGDQVLVVGNLVQPGRHPIIDPDGKTSLRGWARVLRDLHRDFRDNEKLQVVPASGKAGPAQLLLEQADYLEQVLDFATDAHRHGLTLKEMLEDRKQLEGKLKGREGKPSRELLELAYRATGA